MAETNPAIVQALLTGAEEHPDVTAYEFLRDDGVIEALSYGDLLSRALSVAQMFRDFRDARVLVTYPPSLDYLIALFGCMLAGVIAVPTYPPAPGRPISESERIRLLIENAQPAVAIAHPALDLPVATLSVPVEGVTDTAGVRRPASDIALVQYTSGSVSRPRGVVVTHSSIEHNVAAIRELFEIDEASRALVWLPPYHDMGLIGGILTPLLTRIPVRIMSPLTFLKNPLIWLAQISEMRATISGGPNFAYDLCTRRSAMTGLGDLDLTTWKVAFNGAEPVQDRTIRSFAERFSVAGFKSTAFLPCYGLAEATLLVSGSRWRPTGAGRGRVSCGRPARGQRIAIVDPARCIPVADGVEGEIWVAGAHVTAGYLADDSTDLFGLLHSERFVRTGDLGYISAGELYVTGRIKDVLVWRGTNYHATDIEAAAYGAADGLRSIVAAFVSEDETATVLVIESSVLDQNRSHAVAAVRRQVLERTGLRMDQVILVPPKSIPRTSSGKVQRVRCRAEHAAGRYERFRDDQPPATADREVRARARLTELIQGAFAAVCDVGDCADTDSFVGLGGDSIRAGEVAAALEHALGVDVNVELVLRHLTPRALADALLDGSRDLDAVFEALDAV